MALVLYDNGTIITMRGDEPETVEAVLTEDGTILAAGTASVLAAQAASRGGASVERRDLKGAVMLPAFIDSHSHITAVTQVFGYESLTDVTGFGELAERLKRFKERARIAPGEWIVGVGYDHNFLKEKRHPDRHFLDGVFKENPVVLSHVSGHMGAVNSMALERMHITAETKNPEGGVIGRMAGSDEPDGYLEETAFTEACTVIPKPTMEQLARQFALAERLYLSKGITTVQDGITRAGEWDILSHMAEHGMIHTDVVAYADMRSDKALIAENPDYAGTYHNHLRIGGYKIFLDGSPQGRTAWMSRPYERGDGADGQTDTQAGQTDQACQTGQTGLASEAGYCGYPIYRDEETEQFLETAFAERRQILVHCNGDAAAEQMIDACGRAARTTGCELSDIRPVMIHAQLVWADQLKRMAKLSMTASFFVAHTYYWGDVHLKNFGRGRALKISPVRTALNEHVNVTLHQDSPVIEPDMLETVWCAVNRLSRDGTVMGADETVSPYEALKAVTCNAAWQYGEEREKGTIEAGKRADFVILDRDPLKTAAEAIRDIRVLETIKDGVTLYRAEPV